VSRQSRAILGLGKEKRGRGIRGGVGLPTSNRGKALKEKLSQSKGRRSRYRMGGEEKKSE